MPKTIVSQSAATPQLFEQRGQELHQQCGTTAPHRL